MFVRAGALALSLVVIGCSEAPSTSDVDVPASENSAVTKTAPLTTIISSAQATEAQASLAAYEADLQKANQLAANGDLLAAEQAYRKLHSDLPYNLAPANNLAVVLAKQGKTKQARDTLVAAIEDNASAQRTLATLREINRVLAAQAYQQALNEKTKSIGAGNYRLANSLDQTLSTMSVLKNRLASRDTDFEALRQQVAEQKQSDQSAVASLQRQLSDAQNQLVSAQQTNQSQSQIAADSESEIARLNAQISQLTVAVAQRDKQIEALKQQPVVVASVSTEPATSNTTQPSSTEISSVIIPIEEPTPATQVVVQQVSPQVQPKTVQPDPVAELDIDEVGAALVKSWAQSWSAQDVDAYVSHYRQGYVPLGKGLSNKQWKAQRRVRLTNKRFIDVGVSEFDVVDLGDRFEVSFRQHYRSNTLDDVIRKKLTFAKNTNDPRKSKIIDEQVVRS